MAGVDRAAFTARPRELTYVPTEEWTPGHGVYVRPLKVRERLQMAQDLNAAQDAEIAGTEATLQVALWCVSDEEGNPLLTDDLLEDFVLKSSAPLVAINRAVMELSGISIPALVAADEAGIDLGGDTEDKPQGKARSSRPSGKRATA